MSISRIKSQIISQECIAEGIFSMWLCAPGIAQEARPGQFVSVYSKDRSRLLPRPISICETDRRRGWIRLVYRIAGLGTLEFSSYGPSDELEIMGPLGNGYDLDAASAAGRSDISAASCTAILAAGGIGIPPMLELAKELECKKIIVLGYRDELFLNKEFAKLGRVVISTEDGSAGTCGNVLDAIREQDISGDVIYSCGPTPMLRAVKKYAADCSIPAWISLEERMACGVGACLACVCRSTEKDSHSNVNNKRVCRDGPVFDAREVEI